MGKVLWFLMIICNRNYTNNQDNTIKQDGSRTKRLAS